MKLYPPLKPLRLLSVPILTILAAACSSRSEDAQVELPPDQPAISNDYVIPAYIGTETPVRVTFGAVAKTDVATQSAPKALSGQLTTAGAGTTADAIAGMGVNDIMRMAASQCGVGANRFRAASGPSNRCSALEGLPRQAYSLSVPGAAPSTAGIPSCLAPNTLSATVPFAIFSAQAETCDQQIDQQEMLLCTAGLLADLADAETPTTWAEALRALSYIDTDHKVDIGAGILLSSLGVTDAEAKAFNVPPVLFPVLDPKTKFLVRDLALNVLGYIPLLDSRPYSVNSVSYTCSELYAKAPTLAAGTVQNAAYTRLYNTPTDPNATTSPTGANFYPPIPATTSWPPTQSRLAQLSAVLRGAGQMTKDLIDRSVDGDLAAAAEKVASLPPEQRNQALWAGRDPFNSMAHAARVLYGRQAVLGFNTNSALRGVCATYTVPSIGQFWVQPEDLWLRYPISSLNARGRDPILRTADEAKADSMLAQAGILFDGTRTASQVRAALPLALSARGLGSQAAMSAQVATLSDGALLVATGRQAASIGAVTNATTTPDILGTPTTAAGMQANLNKVGVSATLTANYLSLTKPVRRSEVTMDGIALMGRLSTGSTCSEVTPGVLTGGYGASTFGTTTMWLPQQMAYQTTDAFAVAQALRSRGIVLRTAASLAGGATPEQTKARDGAIAELDTWAGGLRVSAQSAGTNVTVDLYDIDLASFKSSGSTVASDFALVFGTTEEGGATAASCAAGTGPCPQVVPGTTWNASSALLNGSNDGKILRDRYTLTFLASSLGTAAPANTIGGRTMYLVRKGQNGAKGIVLGALKAPSVSAAMNASFVFSPYRNQLLERVFGFSGNTSGLGNSLGDTRDMCIPGVPRDLYVPMESEMSSDGDAYESSWRHYLTLAKEAANKADSLGREMLEAGLSRDSRSEGLAAASTDIMGVTLPNPDCAKGSDSSECGETVANFLNEKTLDLVLLTNDPLKGVTDPTQRRTTLRTFLGCQGNNLDSPVCAKLQPPSSPTAPEQSIVLVDKDSLSNIPLGFTYAALGLATLPVEAKVDASACLAAASSVQQDPLVNLETLFQDPKLSNDEVYNFAIQGTRMLVAEDGEFAMYFYGNRVADSRALGADGQPSHVWPGCLRGGDCEMLAVPPTTRGQVNTTLDRAFNRCTGQNAALGQCNGSAGDIWRDLNEIRWEMQGAAWLGLALTGRIPSGAFETPVPGVDFGAGPIESPASDHACALPATAFGAGTWTPSPAPLPYSMSTAPWSSGSVGASETAILNALGPVQVVNPNFLRLSADSVQSMPEWYRAIYDPTKGGASSCFARGFPRAGGGSLSYVHVRAKSVQLTWSEDSAQAAGEYFAAVTGHAGAVGPGMNLEGLRALSRTFTQSPSPFAGKLNIFVGAMKNSMDDGFYLRRAKDGFGLQSRHPAIIDWQGNFNQFYRNTHADQVGGFSPNDPPTAYYWTGRDHNPFWDTLFVWPCADWGYDRSDWGKCIALPGERLPSFQSPDVRTRFFVNSATPLNDSEAMRQTKQAMTLGCLSLVEPPRGQLADPPQVSSSTDLVSLDSWLRARVDGASQLLGRLHATDVPAVVVHEFINRKAGGVPMGGRAGDASLQAGAALERTSASFKEVVRATDSIRRSTTTLRMELARLDAAASVKDASRRLQDLQAARDLAVGGASGMAAAGSGNFSGLASAGVSAAFQPAIIAATTTLRDAQDKEDNAERRIVFTRFADETARNADNQVAALSTTRQAAIDFLRALNALKTERTKALDAVARASGAGAWVCGTDSAQKTIQCTSPVNTVMNRRFNAAKIRYEAALRDARAMGYIARRAIEERFGQRLDQLSSPIGPLAAPSTWADSICSMSGIDYATLRKEKVGEPGSKAPLTPTELAVWTDPETNRLANAFVGDYVDNLQQFINYYPIAFPSHDGDDSTLVSLREDVFRQKDACRAPGRNLLASSDGASTPNVNTTTSLVGEWQIHLCDPNQANCLRASRAALATTIILPNGVPQPSTITLPGGLAQTATWLRNEARFTDALGRDESGLNAPGNLVSQGVDLEPGKYTLSFYGMALTSTGGVVGASATNYRATVLSEAGMTIATTIVTTDVGAFTNRRSLTFTIPSRGLYRVGFGASSQPGTAGASLALAEPQLERDERGEGATEYQSTDSAGLASVHDCASTGAQLRSRFARRCEGGRCFYELTAPFALDTSDFSVNGNSLYDKLAAANFNYRHIDVAVNLVGTGLKNCDGSPTPGCYAAGTVDYDLTHEANGIGIVAYDSLPRVFDFGTGRIAGGKALATERYLTLPIAGSDASLVQQQGVLKTELRGRPLDGRYTLRIYDTPALRWEKLEDIQFLLHSRYWSRVDSPSSL